MRLLKRDLKTVWLKKRKVTDSPKGGQKIEYVDPQELKMVIKPASVSVMAQIYGERLNTVKECQYQGELIQEVRNEKDGVCVGISKDEKPNYEITSIQTFTDHLTIILERL